MSGYTRISDPEFDAKITLREAFHVLVKFIEQYNSRAPQETDILQADLTLEKDGSTSDPAQLDDFLSSAKSVIKSDLGPNNSSKRTR